MTDQDEESPHEMADPDPALVRTVAAFYAGVPDFDPAARERVKQALARPPRAMPRWWGLAAAAGLAGLAFLAGWSLGQRHPAQSAAGDETTAALAMGTPMERVRFSLAAAGAHQVSLVGAFNNWDVAATPLVRNAADGAWEVSVLLPPGLHTYSFVVDRTTWTVDPMAPRAGDDFGSRNAVILVRGDM